MKTHTQTTETPIHAAITAGTPDGASQTSQTSIVIFDRGFVLVGEARIDGDWVVTEKASVIRRWGTTKGLGEIALNGPTKDTKLDPIGIVRSPLRALIGLVACEPGKWTL